MRDRSFSANGVLICLLLWIATLSMVIGKPCLADDQKAFLVDSDGKVFQLYMDPEEVDATANWQPRQMSVFDEKSVFNPDQTVSHSVNTTFLIEKDSVKISGQGANILNAPPGGIQYKNAHADANGNIYVELGGKGKGFNYKKQGAATPIVANKMEWENGLAPPEGVVWVGNPHGEGLIGLTPEGSIALVDPPTFSKQFKFRVLDPQAGAKSLLLINNRLLALKKNGTLFEIYPNDAEVHWSDAKSLPNQITKGPLELIANTDPHFKEKLEALSQSKSKKSTPPKASAIISGTPPAQNGPHQIKLVSELIQESRGSDIAKMAAQEFVESAEHVYYDIAANALNNGDSSTKHFGREKEMREVVNVLSKENKHHLIIKGPAGVGKTSLVKHIQNRFVRGEAAVLDEAPPIIIELSIETLTHASDPSQIKSVLRKAIHLSKLINRRVVLFIDEAHVATKMTQNAMKSFLSEAVDQLEGQPKVHVFFATTSGESEAFMRDKAFSRRFSHVHLNAFNREETVKLIKQTFLPRWQKTKKKRDWRLSSITDEAFEYAYRYRHTEQPYSETGTQEILEAAIVAKMNRETDPSHSPVKPGEATLDVADIQRYLKEKHDIRLMPGDPDFDKNFDEMWRDFESTYVGNEAMKASLKTILRTHFGQPKKNNMTSLAIFGPPGGGKTYAAETIAKSFFKGAVLTTNGAELKNGSLELNKLLGSPPGTVGHEENRSSLAQMLKDHPEGFVWKIEEADYLNQDVIQLLTNIITDKKFKDGLGQEWDTSRVMIWMNSNIGQDLMIPIGTKNKMNWSQYEMRKSAATQKVQLNGQVVDVVRPDLMNGIFNGFIEKIVTSSHPGEDTSAVEQEAAKQIRRYTPLYCMPPTRKELEEAAIASVNKFVKDSNLENGVHFEIPRDVILKLVDLNQYQFKQGHSYVINQLQNKLYNKLLSHLSERGSTIHVSVQDAQLEIGEGSTDSQNLIVAIDGRPPVVHSLGSTDLSEKNPWGSSQEMMTKIDHFAENMSRRIKGNGEIIEDMATVLKSKAVDWNSGAVFTFLGTSGNGKTEMAKATAQVLFGDESAMFKITGVDHPWDLAEHFRPPSGIENSNKVTEFEKWFKSRKAAGGGVILFDELLSEIGKSSDVTMGGQRGGKIAVLQELYELLDEQRLKIGGKYEDARGFVVVLTGNTLQELFAGIDDNPEAASLVKKIREKLSRSAVVDQLKKRGLDAPKIARLGNIYVLGPQPSEVSLEVGRNKIEQAIKQINEGRSKSPIEIRIDGGVVKAVVDRLSTVELGMREVNAGFKTLVFDPLNAIIADLSKIKKIKITKIEMKLDNSLHPRWYVDGEEIARRGEAIAGSTAQKMTWDYKKNFTAKSRDRTPNLNDLNSVQKMQYTPELLRSVAVHEVYGHWMVNAMLNRENGADFLSLLPGSNYLGYVRPKEQEVADLTNLTSSLKRIVELEAGHRAVFYMGDYSTGGGNGGERRSNSDAASDDLGKIQRLIHQMINNSMIHGIEESSSGQEKDFLIALLEKVFDHLADEVIHLGIESNLFKPAFDHVMKERYLTREKLDAFLRKVEFSKFGYLGKDALFMEKFSASIAHVLLEKEKDYKEKETKKDPGAAKEKSDYERAKRLLSGIVGRSFREAEGRAHGKTKELAELGKIKQALKDAVHSTGKNLPVSMVLRAVLRGGSPGCGEAPVEEILF